MSTFTQLPGTLDLTFVQGDEVAIALDFDRDLTGFQVTAPLYVTAVFASGGGGSSFVETVCSTATNFAISYTNRAAGQLLLGLGGGGIGRGFSGSPAWGLTATAGGTNTGGGGGGTHGQGAASGGSGVVIIRAPRSAASTTGSPTVTTVDGETVYVFNGSGSITF